MGTELFLKLGLGAWGAMVLELFRLRQAISWKSAEQVDIVNWKLFYVMTCMPLIGATLAALLPIELTPNKALNAFLIGFCYDIILSTVGLGVRKELIKKLKTLSKKDGEDTETRDLDGIPIEQVDRLLIYQPKFLECLSLIFI